MKETCGKKLRNYFHSKKPSPFVVQATKNLRAKAGNEKYPEISHIQIRDLADMNLMIWRYWSHLSININVNSDLYALLCCLNLWGHNFITHSQNLHSALHLSSKLDFIFGNILSWWGSIRIPYCRKIMCEAMLSPTVHILEDCFLYQTWENGLQTAFPHTPNITFKSHRIKEQRKPLDRYWLVHYKLVMYGFAAS